jgi:hypothetical protein
MLNAGTIPRCIGDGAWVWRISHVVIGRTAGFGIKLIGQPASFDFFIKNRLSQWRSANVTQADKENFGHSTGFGQK